MNDNFLAGVVEGFYGQTWKQSQRLKLFHQLTDWGLNTYFYSPKDDLKHRAIWRELYDDSEITSLAELVKSCQQVGINFIYGLSPGLDIRFSDPLELQAIKNRFSQMIELGVTHFALLFDDLPGEIQAIDRSTYDSVAAAQSGVTNHVYAWLKGNVDASRLLFCPTPYCDRMDRWELGGSDYLDVLGRTLNPEIEILWTGPEIISETISVPSIQALSRRIQRKPILWDNLHANDYDLRRLFCGPYSGRSHEILQNVRGILSNPNNEFPINYIPIRSLGDFVTKEADYDAGECYQSSLKEWISDYTTVGQKIALEDLRLLTDSYYLPYTHGCEAKQLKQLVEGLLTDSVEDWGNRYDDFLAMHHRVEKLLESLTQLTDRELFYAWSRRIWEFKEEMDLLKDFLARKKDGDVTNGFASETHLPKTCRGGIVAELQQLLTMDENGRFQSRSDG